MPTNSKLATKQKAIKRDIDAEVVEGLKGALRYVRGEKTEGRTHTIHVTSTTNNGRKPRGHPGPPLSRG